MTSVLAGGTAPASWGLCDMPIRLSSLQLMKDKSRAEEFLHQSLPYLRDPQATVREVAVRFIGEPQPLETRFWAAWPPVLLLHCPVPAVCRVSLPVPPL